MCQACSFLHSCPTACVPQVVASVHWPSVLLWLCHTRRACQKSVLGVARQLRSDALHCIRFSNADAGTRRASIHPSIHCSAMKHARQCLCFVTHTRVQAVRCQTISVYDHTCRSVFVFGARQVQCSDHWSRPATLVFPISDLHSFVSEPAAQLPAASCHPWHRKRALSRTRVDGGVAQAPMSTRLMRHDVLRVVRKAETEGEG